MRLRKPRIRHLAAGFALAGAIAAAPAMTKAQPPVNTAPAVRVVVPDGLFGRSGTDATPATGTLQTVQYYRHHRRWRRPPRHWRYRHHRRPHYRRGRAHVRWCLNRYRSYNPRTDRFLGYDGRYHRCRSPFR